jgi:hypothetical protein
MDAAEGGTLSTSTTLNQNEKLDKKLIDSLRIAEYPVVVLFRLHVKRIKKGCWRLPLKMTSLTFLDLSCHDGF